MPNIKTAISIEKPIFDQVNDLAQKLNVSRSRLFVLAVQEFIRHYENLGLLDDINEAYDDLQESEIKNIEKMQPGHLKRVKDQW